MRNFWKRTLTIWIFIPIAVLWFLCFSLFSCKNETTPLPPLSNDTFIRSCDASFLPQVRASGLHFINAQGINEDMLLTMKNAGANTIRLRIWHSPVNDQSSLQEVKKLSDEIKNLGLKVWLTIHYSDTWADPGSQIKPKSWQLANFRQLKDSVYNYTARVVQLLKPEYVQIGNEINNGLLFPDGSFSNKSQMSGLLTSGIKAVKDQNQDTRIILHYAGHENSVDFFAHLSTLDYDIIGISYYPLWHGKNLNTLMQTLHELSNTYQKKVVIAETSYPFTYQWNDHTQNVIGDSTQILSQFSASPEGQKNYLVHLKNLLLKTPGVIGFSYWGGEWVSFKGKTAIDGSSWENQALWDFNQKSLPALDVFKQE